MQKLFFILQSVHLPYKYAIRIHFCFIRSRRINFSYYTNKLFSLRINIFSNVVVIFVCTLPINKIKGYLFSILALSGPSFGSPYRVCQIMALTVHLPYKYAIRIHFCFIRSRRINFSYYTNKLFSLRINFPGTL
jgi:hypothetical protein